jgi:hypothetical protein
VKEKLQISNFLVQIRDARTNCFGFNSKMKYVTNLTYKTIKTINFPTSQFSVLQRNTYANILKIHDLECESEPIIREN